MLLNLRAFYSEKEIRKCFLIQLNLFLDFFQLYCLGSFYFHAGTINMVPSG
jgi:hypothetical protein